MFFYSNANILNIMYKITGRRVTAWPASENVTELVAEALEAKRHDTFYSNAGHMPEGLYVTRLFGHPLSLRRAIFDFSFNFRRCILPASSNGLFIWRGPLLLSLYLIAGIKVKTSTDIPNNYPVSELGS
jgi:hypothetical protein